MVTDDIDIHDLPLTRKEINRGYNAARLTVENTTEEIQWIWKHRHDKEKNRLVRLQRVRTLIRWLRRAEDDLEYWRSLLD